MKFTPLHYGLLAFVGGVMSADIFREYWVLNGVFIFLVLLILKKNSIQQTLLYSGLFLLGCIRLFFAIPEDTGVLFTLAQQEEKISVVGIIDSLPVQGRDKISFYLESQAYKKITKKDEPQYEWQKITDRALVNVYGIHTLEYGDRVEVVGKILQPKNSVEFSYGRYLQREDVYAYFGGARVTKLPPKEAMGIWTKTWREIFAFRKNFETQVREKITTPESEYALGIILGAEKGIPQYIIDDFNDTGLRHLLALSGFNITILLLFIFWIFGFLPIKARIAVALIIIAIFVGLTGASSSVVRAAIMGGIGMMILHSGRDADVLNLVGLTLLILLLWNPFLLVADPGLQLSVLAVLGLYFYVPLIEKIMPLGKNFPLPLKQALWATLAAQIFTLPLMIVYFGQFSLISPLANMIVAPLTTLSMIFASLVVLPYLGWVMMPIAYIFLHFSLTLTHLMASIPFAVIEFPQINKWWLIVLYVPVVLGVFLRKK